jgi:hypothetical protein
MADGDDGAFVCAAEQWLQLGEHHPAPAQIGAVGRQERHVCACGAGGAADGDTLLITEIVEHDDIARLERAHRKCRIQARKIAALTGPSTTHVASMRAERSAARKVMVFH